MPDFQVTDLGPTLLGEEKSTRRPAGKPVHEVALECQKPATAGSVLSLRINEQVLGEKKIVRANIKFLITGALVILCGLVTGWYFIPRSLWQKELAPFYPRPSNTELLISALENNSHCGTLGLREERAWQEKKLLPMLLNAGEIVMTAPGQYQMREQLWLNAYGNHVASAVEFGWVETNDYLEIYYITPRNYAAIVKKFKQQPTKSGENEIDITKIVTPDGLTAIRSLHISKIRQGTRVACRELKATS